MNYRFEEGKIYHDIHEVYTVTALRRTDCYITVKGPFHEGRFHIGRAYMDVHNEPAQVEFIVSKFGNGSLRSVFLASDVTDEEAQAW